jgi:hypothetical protein
VLPLPRSVAARRFALLIFAVFALALGTHAVRAARARYGFPTGAAEWIWKPMARDESSPVAFDLVRDFALDPPPARARLLVAADEEYILYLNGRRLGSGRLRVGQKGRRGTLLDTYEIADELAPGGNRLVVEVRSGRGVGGLLLALLDGASGRVLLGTDERWRIFRRDDPFLLRGLAPIQETGEPSASWGLPPMGRWGVPEVDPARSPRPLYRELAAAGPPATARPLTLADPPARGLPPVPRTVFDFGREVTGYLHLDFAPDRVQRSGLLYTGSAGIPSLGEARPDGAVITLPGRNGWDDACPRRLRYAMVLGLAPRGAKVQPVDPARVAPLLLRPPRGASARPEGVFGLAPPPLRSPVEHEVGREFQRLPGVARREEL